MSYILLEDSPIFRKPNGSKTGKILQGRVIEIVEFVPGWVRFNSPAITPEPDRQWLPDRVVSKVVAPEPEPEPDITPFALAVSGYKIYMGNLEKE